MCVELMESYHIFGAVSRMSHCYSNKELYVIKRLWKLCQDERSYQDCGAPADATFEGKGWIKGGSLPCDAEVVASVFCGLMDYSMSDQKDNHIHLFDNSVSQFTLNQLKKTDVAMLNRQPKLLYRAHFELVFRNKYWATPSG